MPTHQYHRPKPHSIGEYKTIYIYSLAVPTILITRTLYELYARGVFLGKLCVDNYKSPRSYRPLNMKGSGCKDMSMLDGNIGAKQKATPST